MAIKAKVNDVSVSRWDLTSKAQLFPNFVKSIEAEEGAKMIKFQLIKTGKQTEDLRDTQTARLTLSNGVFITLFCGADFAVSNKKELDSCKVLEQIGGTYMITKDISNDISTTIDYTISEDSEDTEF